MQSIDTLLKDFDKASKEYLNLMRILPRKIGILGVKATKRNFLLQGMEINGTFKSWKKRSFSTNSIYDSRKGVKGSVFSSKNPILIQTGNLRSSIDYVISEDKVEIGCNLNQVPYAKLMQEGGTVEFNQEERTQKMTWKYDVNGKKRLVSNKKSKGDTDYRESKTYKFAAKKSMVKIPARPFLGYTKYLENSIKVFIESEQSKALNTFKK